MPVIWNPWHGCTKISEGCKNCYVFRGDKKWGIDSSQVSKTQNFDLPLKKNRNGEYKIPTGSRVWTCFTSDFFIEQADSWRPIVWQIIQKRKDLHFFIPTKRVYRIQQCLPEDWGEGYDNVTISCTVENQRQANLRLPEYKKLAIKHKSLLCEPLLESIDLEPWIGSWIELIVVGGESGGNARTCNFDWVRNIRAACVESGIPFWFKQTGANFVKEGIAYTIERKSQIAQAKKAGIDFDPT
ncbi:DUF5131 family protein [uncultured Acetobacteroides sp.]|uniref:DUF5131 family protein n=1 Tax=uncultured Acetobacteroides sp. TaxID=1760811 RepID=UPI0029F4B67C|nr:DUF5131 family protein [uncultured Acetobacteroides sp.]